MHTSVLNVDPAHPDPAYLQEATQVLRRGGLVAFPTETVYGLGAHALDAAAVAGIYRAKGRPATNPVIVHVHDVASLRPLVRDFPESAQRLAERFWPGPLSMVLPKSDIVPDIVTASGPTVAIRIPAHPIALALLRIANLPLAAPSANRSTCLSPTRAEHVLRGLEGRIDVLLDGGPTSGGLESTVVDMTTTPPRLLRPGLIAPAALEAVLGPIERRVVNTGPARSPGLQERHYAPATPLECVYGTGETEVECALEAGNRIGLLTFEPFAPPAGVLVERMPNDAGQYAAKLYEVLHRMDAAGVERILVCLPPEGDEWLAVHDRMSRAQRRE